MSKKTKTLLNLEQGELVVLLHPWCRQQKNNPSQSTIGISPVKGTFLSAPESSDHVLILFASLPSLHISPSSILDFPLFGTRFFAPAPYCRPTTCQNLLQINANGVFELDIKIIDAHYQSEHLICGVITPHGNLCEHPIEAKHTHCPARHTPLRTPSLHNPSITIQDGPGNSLAFNATFEGLFSFINPSWKDDAAINATQAAARKTARKRGLDVANPSANDANMMKRLTKSKMNILLSHNIVSTNCRIKMQCYNNKLKLLCIAPEASPFTLIPSRSLKYCPRITQPSLDDIIEI